MAEQDIIILNDSDDLDLEGDYAGYLFEQYKLAVEMASRVTQQRQTTNRYFITIFAAVVAAYGTVLTKRPLDTDLSFLRIALPGIGLVAGFLWLQILEYSKALNSAKFKIINHIETKLPARVFRAEWNFMREKKAKLIGHTQFEIWFVRFCMLASTASVIIEIWAYLPSK